MASKRQKKKNMSKEIKRTTNKIIKLAEVIDKNYIHPKTIKGKGKQIKQDSIYKAMWKEQRKESQLNKYLSRKYPDPQLAYRQRQAERIAQEYNWGEDDNTDNVQQHLAIKKYYEWVKQGLIKESSILDKYQYVAYLNEVATPEMLEELVNEYAPTVERVMKRDEEERQRRAYGVADWSAWGF